MRLAETLGAPVALTINAKGMLPSTHPLLLGSTQTLVATRALVAEADVVLAIGTELAETDYDVTFAGGFELQVYCCGSTSTPTRPCAITRLTSRW